MKRIDGYIKTTLSDVPYLLPYGQNIADHMPSMQLNHSGSLLSDALLQGADRDALLRVLAEEYHAAPSELPVLEKDLDTYLASLKKAKILAPEENLNYEKNFFFSIGELVFSCRGSMALSLPYFDKFACPPTKHADQVITIAAHKPPFHKNGTILVRSSELLICDAGEDYLFLFPASWNLYEMYVKKDGSAATLYCMPDAEKTHADDLFHALRFAFLILAQNRDLFVVHSASILYQEKAWLFSGSSGTGKSTHTRLWNKCFDTPFLNGDLNLIGIKDGVPVVYGLPWCGTSNLCTEKTYPLGGVVFLKQSAVNQAAVPSSDQKTLFLMQRMISPSWTKELVEKNLCFAEKIASIVPIFRFSGTKEADAAETMKQTIDAYIQ